MIEPASSRGCGDSAHCPADPDLPLIQVQDYHKVYGQTVAVQGLTFDVQAGAILGLVGPNGAGKTTTLRALAGILAPTRGRLRIAGRDIVAEPVPAKLQLAYVPDEPKLFDALTAWEHLRFIAATYRVDDFERRAGELLQCFELTEKRDVLAQELSRGMRQKVAICCAYLHDPRVIMFDEPLTGLDPRAIRTFKESVVERAERGSAIIISSHLLSLVEDLCTHLLILHHGQCLFVGPLGEARSRFEGLAADASLEEVFFRVTEQSGTNSSPGDKHAPEGRA